MSTWGECRCGATLYLRLCSHAAHMESPWAHIYNVQNNLTVKLHENGVTITRYSVHVLSTWSHHGYINIIFMYSKTELDWFPWFPSFLLRETHNCQQMANQMDLVVKWSLILTNLRLLVLTSALNISYSSGMVMKPNKVLCYMF